ncbi:MAG: SIR2 family protein [candidate division Zixibacteria bacterium]|nr:SIR2 family protein [candidate division Zixibacteria bacterium]
MEQYLANISQQVEDGFTVPTDGNKFSRWCPEQLNQEQASVRLLKLHGSLDWHWVIHREHQKISSLLARGTLESLEESVLLGGNSSSDHWEVNDRSVLLVGSYNKTERYTSGVFGEVFWHARREIMGTPRLLVCGYGFRDVGVNLLLVDWASGNPDGRLVVLAHRGVDELTAKMDPWMRRWYKVLGTEGVLRSIEHVSIQDLSWSDHIAPCLQKTASSQ